MKYFTLGESMLTSTDSPSEIAIARQMLALGIGLAYRQNDVKLASSMCIALAQVESDPMMSSDLWDFALMIDPSRYSAWLTFREARLVDLAQIRQDAARCLYSARFVDTELATSLYQRRDIREMIAKAAGEADLDPVEIDRQISSLITGIPDDNCRGRVFIAERSDGEMRRIVCQDHSRPIGSTTNDDVLRRLLKLELVLLNQLGSSDSDDTWETNEYLGLNEPARDPSASMIADFYNVDITKPYWRSDRWSPSP